MTFDYSDLILITEHWLNEYELLCLKLKNFTLCSYFCRANSIHGGTAVYINDRLSIKYSSINVLEFCKEGILECSAVIVKDYDFLIIVIYRPPSGDFNEFLLLLNGLLEFASSFRAKIIIGGDFNVDFLEKSYRLNLLSDLLGCYEVKSTIAGN